MTPEELRFYNLALDEVYFLRGLAAYEANQLAWVLSYASLPKGCRVILEVQQERLRAMARGEASQMYGQVGTSTVKDTLVQAGASQTLTRAQFEEQKSEDAS